MSQPPEPLSVQQLLGSAGAPPVVPWRGDEYTLGFNHQTSKARLEELIRQKVLDDLAADCAGLSPPAAAAHEKRVMGLLDKRHYATLQEGWLDRLAAADGSGTVLFVRALFHEHHPKLKEADVWAMLRDEPARMGAALRVVAPDFFGHAARTDRRLPPEQGEALAAELTAAVLVMLTRLDTSPPPRPSSPSSAASPGASASTPPPG